VSRLAGRRGVNITSLANKSTARAFTHHPSIPSSKRRGGKTIKYKFMLTRKQKEEIVKNLAEEIKSAKAVVFSDFKGLEVKDMTSLKKELKKEGASFKVAKKNLINIALKNTGTDLDVKKMEGQIAVSVSSEDETAAAKIISKFSKKNENLKILGGLLGVKEMSVEEIKALAKLPSKEELLAKLVGGLSSPLSGFMNVLRGNQRSLVQALKAIGEKKA